MIRFEGKSENQFNMKNIRVNSLYESRLRRS